MSDGRPTYWDTNDPDREVDWHEASAIWAQASIPFLKALAGMRGNHITYKTWAEYVTEQTGIDTSRMDDLQSWPGQVLGQVLNLCSDEGLPALSSLVVNQKNGMCGPGFGAYHGLYEIYIDDDDPERLRRFEDFAAILRTDCYKKFARPRDERRDDWEPFHTPIHLTWREKQGWPPPAAEG